jgi:hypothetical protein
LPAGPEKKQLSVTICYQPVKLGVKTVDSKLAFFDTLRRVAGHSGYANEFIVGRANLENLRVFRDSLEFNSVDYQSTHVIIEAIEAHGEVKVWWSIQD